jgi:hypothetical protein
LAPSNPQQPREPQASARPTPVLPSTHQAPVSIAAPSNIKPVIGQNLEVMPSKDFWALAARFWEDTHTQKGQSDKYGDWKHFVMTLTRAHPELRSAEYVALETSVDTPEANNTGKAGQRDTNMLFATIGALRPHGNNARIDASVRFGTINVISPMRDFMDWWHKKAGGISNPRHSAASSNPKALIGVALAYERDLLRHDFNGVTATLTGRAEATAGTDRVAAGLGASVSITNDGKAQIVLPNNTPKLRPGKIRASIGVRGAGVAYDVTSASSGTNPLQVKGEVRLDVGITKNIQASAFLTSSPTNEVVRGNHRLDSVGASVIWTF